MAAQSASSWCPGALKGQVVAHGTIPGSAAAQDVGIVGGGAAVVAFSLIPLPDTAFPAGGRSPIPNSCVVIASDSVTAAGVAAGAVSAGLALNGVGYTSPAIAGNWFSMAATQGSGSYQWWIYG
jgi:hypothetical protein